MNHDKSFIPSKALSISFCVGTGLLLRRVYIDITIPGVQNPHWDPWDSAIRSLISRKKKEKKSNNSAIRYVNVVVSDSQKKRVIVRSITSFSEASPLYISRSQQPRACNPSVPIHACMYGVFNDRLIFQIDFPANFDHQISPANKSA